MIQIWWSRAEGQFWIGQFAFGNPEAIIVSRVDDATTIRTTIPSFFANSLFSFVSSSNGIIIYRTTTHLDVERSHTRARARARAHTKVSRKKYLRSRLAYRELNSSMSAHTYTLLKSFPVFFILVFACAFEFLIIFLPSGALRVYVCAWRSCTYKDTRTNTLGYHYWRDPCCFLQRKKESNKRLHRLSVWYHDPRWKSEI